MSQSPETQPTIGAPFEHDDSDDDVSINPKINLKTVGPSTNAGGAEAENSSPNVAAAKASNATSNLGKGCVNKAKESLWRKSKSAGRKMVLGQSGAPSRQEKLYTSVDPTEVNEASEEPKPELDNIDEEAFLPDDMKSPSPPPSVDSPSPTSDLQNTYSPSANLPKYSQAEFEVHLQSEVAKVTKSLTTQLTADITADVTATLLESHSQSLQEKVRAVEENAAALVEDARKEAEDKFKATLKKAVDEAVEAKVKENEAFALEMLAKLDKYDDDAKVKAAELTAVIAEKDAVIAEKDAMIAEKDAHISQKDSQIAVVGIELAKAEASNSELQSQLAQIKEEHRAKIEEVMKEQTALKNQKLSSLKAEAQKQFNEANKIYFKLEGNFKEKEEECEKMAKAIESGKKRLQKVEEEKKLLQKQADEKSSLVSTLTATRDELTQERDALAKKVSVSTSEISGLEAANADRISKLEEANNANAVRFVGQITSKNDEIKGLKERVEGLREDIERKDVEIAELKAISEELMEMAEANASDE